MQELLDQAAQQSKQNSSAGSSVACANRAFVHNSEAENIFARLKQKLLQIKEWNEKSALTSFQLFDSGGVARQEKTAAVNDFIRLDLHGSGKYDWVKIIGVKDATDETVLTVKPHLIQPKNKLKRASHHTFSLRTRPTIFVCEGEKTQ